jgi:hypothetical protein
MVVCLAALGSRFVGGASWLIGSTTAPTSSLAMSEFHVLCTRLLLVYAVD